MVCEPIPRLHWRVMKSVVHGAPDPLNYWSCYVSMTSIATNIAASFVLIKTLPLSKWLIYRTYAIARISSPIYHVTNRLAPNQSGKVVDFAAKFQPLRSVLLSEAWNRSTSALIELYTFCLKFNMFHPMISIIDRYETFICLKLTRSLW